MSDHVGEETTIRSISTDSTGIVLNCDGYDYPYFVLEPVEEVRKVDVECDSFDMRGEAFNVTVSSDGKIFFNKEELANPKEFISLIRQLVKLDESTDFGILLKEYNDIITTGEMRAILEAYEDITAK